MPLLPALLLAAAAAVNQPAWASPQLAAKGGCAVCHVADKPLLGPSARQGAVYAVAGSSGKKRSFFVKSFGRDRLIVSNGKTGKCHFVAVQ